ncbi:MAG: hypothetical protein N2C14_13870, partial [Planctomycetales bacterium]
AFTLEFPSEISTMLKRRFSGLAAVGFLLLGTGSGFAQTEVPTTTIGGGPALGRMLPEKLPRPMRGPDGVLSFVKHVSSHAPDYGIGREEWTPNAPRRTIGGGPPLGPMLPEKPPRPLRGPDSARALIKSITSNQAGDAGDMDALKATLTGVFPDALVRPRQFQEHLAVDGQVRDAAQASQVTELLRAYQSSEAAQLQRGF